MRVALDYAPGLHGHFLELVVNKYIYDVPLNIKNVFQSSGAVHRINLDSEYQQNKIVYRGHYTFFNHRHPANTHKVIAIEPCPKLDFVLLTNVYYRCHPQSLHVDDFDEEEIKSWQEKILGGKSELEFRNMWVFQLVKREPKQKLIRSVLPTYYFDYESFFNLIDFYNELEKLSTFLGSIFNPHPSLAELWTEFIDRNQGWKLYQTGNKLIESVLFERDALIPNDWKLHAYLTFKLSKILGLDYNPLHGNEQYPTSTIELLEVFKKDLKIQHEQEMKYGPP